LWIKHKLNESTGGIKNEQTEYRALIAMIDYGYNVCQGGCAFLEMQDKNAECDKCPYTIARHN